MASAILPYKIIVSNKPLSSTAGAGEAGLEFLSLEDAKAFAVKLRDNFSEARVYIWDGFSGTVIKYEQSGD